MTPEERAQRLIHDLGYQWPPRTIALVAAAICAAINDKLEDAAVNLEGLADGTYTATNTPAQMVRAMKVK